MWDPGVVAQSDRLETSDSQTLEHRRTIPPLIAPEKSPEVPGKEVKILHIAAIVLIHYLPAERRSAYPLGSVSEIE